MIMKRFIPIVSAMLFLIICSSANGLAVDLQYYGIQNEINSDMTISTILTLKFSMPVSHLDYAFDFEIYDLKATADFSWVNCMLDDQDGRSSVSCDFMGMTPSKNTLTLEFNTNMGISMINDKYQYSSRYDVSLPVERAFMNVKLPKNGILAEEVANESFFPPDGKIYTDGWSIIVYWEKSDLNPGDSLEFSVLYTIPLVGGIFYNVVITVMTLIVIVVMLGVVFYVRRSPRTAATVKSVLNRDEKIIVDILSRYKGKIGQKVLVRESDFSKAKISRLVKNMKERGILDIEPISGRENRIMLKIDEMKT
jgi:uncharacterized membrane protein